MNLDNTWKLEDGRTIALIKAEELATLPEGTELVCIDGRTAVVGKDYIDHDTRFGYLAYGRVVARP